MNIFLLINIYFLLSESLCELDMRDSPRLRRLNDLKNTYKSTYNCFVYIN